MALFKKQGIHPLGLHRLSRIRRKLLELLNSPLPIPCHKLLPRFHCISCCQSFRRPLADVRDFLLAEIMPRDQILQASGIADDIFDKVQIMGSRNKIQYRAGGSLHLPSIELMPVRILLDLGTQQLERIFTAGFAVKQIHLYLRHKVHDLFHLRIRIGIKKRILRKDQMQLFVRHRLFVPTVIDHDKTCLAEDIIRFARSLEFLGDHSFGTRIAAPIIPHKIPCMLQFFSCIPMQNQRRNGNVPIAVLFAPRRIHMFRKLRAFSELETRIVADRIPLFFLKAARQKLFQFFLI